MQSEHDYRALFDALPIPAVISRRSDNTVLYANRRHLDMMGVPDMATCLGHDLAEWVHPDDLEKAERNIREVMCGRIPRDDHRYRLVRPDCALREVDIYAILTEFEGESVMLSLMIDMTDIELANRERAAAETRYRTLVELSPDALLVHQDGKLVYLNPAGLEMVGARSLDEVLGISVMQFVAPESAPAVTKRVRAVTERGKPADVAEEWLRRLDGTPFPAEVRAVAVTIDGEPAVQTIARDLSWRQAERAAREVAESRAQAILDSIPLGLHLYQLEEDGRLVFVGANPAADRILDLDHSTLIGLTIEEAFPDLAGTDVPDSYREVAATGTPWANESVAYNEEGRIAGSFDVHVFQTAPRSITVAFEDVTERSRIESDLAEHREHLEHAVEQRTVELTEANAALLEATRAKSAFLASMSHELRTPLNSIIGFSSLLAQGISGPLSAEQKRQIEMVNRSGRQLLSLVSDVLDLAKIEAGRVELLEEAFDVPRLAQALVDSVRPMALEKGLEVTAVTSDAPGIGTADRDKIEQILLNFLSNAIKYTESGSVTLEVVDRRDGTVAFSVADTGVGIPAEEHERVFEEFHQLASRNAAKSPGTGLGLAISRHLAEFMGGTIELHSSVGAGSTFTLVVPIGTDN